MTRIISIAGGADATMAAAIVAVVSHVEESNADTKATRPAVPRPSRWIQSNRPREASPPLPSQRFDAAPWAIAGEDPG